MNLYNGHTLIYIYIYIYICYIHHGLMIPTFKKREGDPASLGVEEVEGLIFRLHF